MVFLRENHFKLSSLSRAANPTKQLDFILIPEENSLVVDFDVEDYDKIFLANFSYEYSVMIHVHPNHKIYGSAEKVYELKPGQNATLFFVKQNKNWYITM